MSIRVGFIDDHPVVVGGLDAALSAADGIEVTARGTTIAEARDILSRKDIDVVLLDIRLPDGNGLELLSEIPADQRPAVLLLSSFKTPQYVAAALRFGAQGFLLKTEPMDVLLEAISRIAAGGSAFTAEQLRSGQAGYVRLTPRERQILRLVLEGRSNDEIAAAIGGSRKTVEAHLTHLYERCGVSTRVELALRADREGWLDIDAL